jgi:RNA polymerase sigma-70 factor (ECF subfamily)
MLAWLRNILRNNIASMHQHHLMTKKRSAHLEAYSKTSTDEGQVELVDLLPSETTSPSQRAMRDEVAAELAASLMKLPDTQKEALRLRYLEGWSLKKISDHLQKSEMAVAGLLKRGLQGLRQELIDEENSE